MNKPLSLQCLWVSYLEQGKTMLCQHSLPSLCNIDHPFLLELPGAEHLACIEHEGG